MKKTIMILAAMALILGLPQCTKQTSGVLEGSVEITLDVKSNNGSRIDVNTANGAVSFEYGDVVYVGSGGKYVGTLICRGTSFKGQIANATLGEPLCFFFLGNKNPEEALAAGSSTTCSVNISDQSSKLPVISFATSDQDFSGEGEYTAFFLNKAALVKFDVTSTTDLVPTEIHGMKNKVTVDFATCGFTYSQEGNGAITLPAGSGERWAILLPQNGVPGSTGFTNDGCFYVTCAAVSTIGVNDYLIDGIPVDFTEAYVDLGLPSGLLWAKCNVGADTPEGYGDYFAWGETSTKSNYDGSNYIYCDLDDGLFTKYCSNPDFGYNGFVDNLTTLLPEDDAATANWGHGWRTPTKVECQELIDNTIATWTTQNGVNGRLFTSNNGNSLFLPAAGYHWFGELAEDGMNGLYWSSLVDAGGPNVAFFLNFGSNVSPTVTFGSRIWGQSVRPVHSARQN